MRGARSRRAAPGGARPAMSRGAADGATQDSMPGPAAGRADRLRLGPTACRASILSRGRSLRHALTRDPAGAGAAGAPPAQPIRTPLRSAATVGSSSPARRRVAEGWRAILPHRTRRAWLRRLTRDSGRPITLPPGAPTAERGLSSPTDPAPAPPVLRDLDPPLSGVGSAAAMPLAASPPLASRCPRPLARDGAPAFLPDGTWSFRRAFSATLFHLFARRGQGGNRCGRSRRPVPAWGATSRWRCPTTRSFS